MTTTGSSDGRVPENKARTASGLDANVAGRPRLRLGWVTGLAFC